MLSGTDDDNDGDDDILLRSEDFSLYSIKKELSK